MSNKDVEEMMEKLLEYSEEFQVLICKQCEHAIQPSAIDRHLKERHQIYRNRRQALLERLSTFSLVDPENVQLPSPDHTAIPFLNVESGLACNHPECHHLCVTKKRMQMHWSAQHARQGNDQKDWRAACLQTFFRGKYVRYFVINALTPTSSRSLSRRSSSASAPLIRVSSSPTSFSSMSGFSGPTSFDMEDLRLLHHYSLISYATIITRHEGPAFWQDTVPQIAFREPFLMHGILSFAALHFAYLHPDQKEYFLHKAMQHQCLGLPKFRSSIKDIDASNCLAVVVFSKFIGVHDCASFVLNSSSGATVSCLKSFVRKCRGTCAFWLGLEKQNATENKYDSTHVKNLLPKQPISHYSGEFTDYQRLTEFHHDFTIVLNSVPPGSSSNCTTAFEELRSCLLYVAESPGIHRTWDALEHWLGNMSDDFIERMISGELQELMLFSHWCVLVVQTQTHWFMDDLAPILLRVVQKMLPEEHHHLIRWPLEAAGLWETSNSGHIFGLT